MWRTPADQEIKGNDVFTKKVDQWINYFQTAIIFISSSVPAVNWNLSETWGTWGHNSPERGVWSRAVVWVHISAVACVKTESAVGLPGRAKEKDVLCLWQINHLPFQSQTADLHPCQLILILHSLHIEQALLSGIHHTYEYFITLYVLF